jgi:hypothetical protein
MKTFLFSIILSLSVLTAWSGSINRSNAVQYQFSLCDSASVIQHDTITVYKRCRCDEGVKRYHKRNGEIRTKVGRVIWDFLKVCKSIIPFLKLL